MFAPNFHHYQIHTVIFYLHAYGYWFVFLGTIFEGEIVLLTAGFLTFLGILNFWTVFVIALLGAVIGDNICFWLGERYGKRFIEKNGRLPFLSKRSTRKLEKYFSRHGVKTIFFSRFVVGTRISSAVLAGATHMRTREFQRANILGAAVWAFVIEGIGYLFGNSFELLKRVLHRSQTALLILVLAVIIILLLRLLLERLELE